MDPVTSAMIDAATAESSAYVVEAMEEYLAFSTIADTRSGVGGPREGQAADVRAAGVHYFVVNNRRVEWKSHRPETVQYPLSGSGA